MGTMGVKLGTKAFGTHTEKAQGTAGGPSNLSANDREKLGGEDVGAMLNKIADPNWVDPQKKVRAVGNANLDKDAFFKLMLAQLKNQDPTNPLKPHEMSAQLANFSSLEQMQNMNTTLTEMKAGQKPLEQFQALNLIGKSVGGDSAKVIRGKGDKEHEFGFDLPANATETKIRVRNSAGDIVRTYDMKDLKQGANKITWNGVDEKGVVSPPDEYSFLVEATMADGKKMAVKSEFEGVITGINYTPEGPVLLVGNQTVRLKDVRKIIDPSLKKNDQNAKDVTGQDLKTQGTVQQTEREGTDQGAQAPAGPAPVKPEAGKAEPQAQSTLDNVGLSRGMMSKLQKEIGTGG